MTHAQQNETLTALQKRFVKEYPLDFIGTEAYLRASGTTNRKSAAVQASKFLKMPKIQAALEDYIEDQLGPQQKRLLENVKFWEEVRDGKVDTGALVQLSDIAQFFDREEGELRDELDEFFDGIRTFVLPANRTADRMKASENLAKYSQMFVERKDVNVSGQVQIVDDVK